MVTWRMANASLAFDQLFQSILGKFWSKDIVIRSTEKENLGVEDNSFLERLSKIKQNLTRGFVQDYFLSVFTYVR